MRRLVLPLILILFAAPLVAEAQPTQRLYRVGVLGSSPSQLLAELASLKVDVIVTIGPAARAAKDATPTIPIVMANSGDLVRDGIIASIARPADTSPA